LGQRIATKEVWRPAFSDATTTTTTIEFPDSTTYPERMDVLVGSRFDTDYLASFNRVLDYHPGNLAFSRAVRDLRSEALVTARILQPVRGVVPRILAQDWATGYWSVMEVADAKEVIRRAVVIVAEQHSSSWKRGVSQHLKSVLADSRFGRMRDTTMAQRFTPTFVSQWEEVIFGTAAAAASEGANETGRSSLKKWKRPPSLTSSKPSTYTKETRSASYLGSDPNVLTIGDRILADYQQSGAFMEATIVATYDAKWIKVEYAIGGYQTLPVRAIQKYESIQEGDEVELDEEGDWYPATVTKVHPFGTYNLEDEDGTEEFDVRRASLRLVPDDDDKPLRVRVQYIPLQMGQRVEANFESSGQWFEGHIDKKNRDGTFAVQFEDGDYEDGLPKQSIRPI
jgi:hypothetical protein